VLMSEWGPVGWRSFRRSQQTGRLLECRRGGHTRYKENLPLNRQLHSFHTAGATNNNSSVSMCMIFDDTVGCVNGKSGAF
jgi:hypothetical protein